MIGDFCYYFIFFFFNDTATTEIYTLSLHDALPILAVADGLGVIRPVGNALERLAERPVARVVDHAGELAQIRQAVVVHDGRDRARPLSVGRDLGADVADHLVRRADVGPDHVP